jgi:hypothetical protein
MLLSAIVERDNIGRSFVAKVLFIEPGYFGPGDQVDRQVIRAGWQQVIKQGASDTTEIGDVYSAHALAVGNDERLL